MRAFLWNPPSTNREKHHLIHRSWSLHGIKLGYVTARVISFTTWAGSLFLLTQVLLLLRKQPSCSQQEHADEQRTVEVANPPTVGAVEDPQELRPTCKENGNDKSMLVFPLAFLLFIIVKDAWLSDDSYITFRVVSNVLRGYGFTWNTDERVQTYTHPLWMFFLSLVCFFTHEIYYSSLILSVTLSFIAVGIFSFFLARSPLLAGLGIMTLAASKSFVDFSTSGLENPLTYLLIVLFMLVFYHRQQKKHYIFLLALIAGLATFNRMDTILLFLPALIFVVYTMPGWKSAKALLLGFSPFLCWEIFSLWYYGFLFPNTAYAKLDTAIASDQLLQQGIGYFVSSFSFDPILFLIIAASIYVIFLQREWTNLPFIVGMGLYMLYTLKIGGDFMAGRFLTEPFLIAVILLTRTPFPALQLHWQPALVIIAIFAIITPSSRWYAITTSPANHDKRGIADERAHYVNATGILNVQRGVIWPNSAWTRGGLQAMVSAQHVVVETNIGFFGFAAGPHVHIVDIWALSDPLLARLPALPGWSIGNFTRAIPAGYLETLKSGKDVIRDRQLNLYYSKLQNLTRGPLFDAQRLIEIWKFNTGAYDYLLIHYSQGTVKILHR